MKTNGTRRHYDRDLATVAGLRSLSRPARLGLLARLRRRARSGRVWWLVHPTGGKSQIGGKSQK